MGWDGELAVELEGADTDVTGDKVGAVAVSQRRAEARVVEACQSAGGHHPQIDLSLGRIQKEARSSPKIGTARVDEDINDYQ